MSAPEGTKSGDGTGPLNGHGVPIAMAAIFVGVGLTVAFVASGGAIFGLNLRPAAGNNDSSPNGSFVNTSGNVSLSDVYNEGANGSGSNDTTSLPEVNTTLAQEGNNTLSEAQLQLLAIGNFRWDPIAEKYVASDPPTIDTVKQNYTRDTPPDPGTESSSLPIDEGVNVDNTSSIDNDIQDTTTSQSDIGSQTAIPTENNTGEQPTANDSSTGGTDYQSGLVNDIINNITSLNNTITNITITLNSSDTNEADLESNSTADNSTGP
jgi:hypothetical protein